ncbi:MAG: hypothetical protein WAV78_47835 [Xanthobacteraceae bacterium]|jgi:hypothetical protein
MSGEVSYCSRFFAKFVEIIAAGLASALTAYLLAHFGGVLLYATPASAPVAPIASEVAESRRAQPIPVVAAAPVNERRTVPQKDTDAPAAQLAPNGGKEAKTLPLRKHTKTDTSVAEKEPRGQKSVEVLTRAALANIDANRPAPVDAPIGSGLNHTNAPVDGTQARQASVTPRQADVGPRPVEIPSRAAAINAAQPVQPRPAAGTNLQPGSPEVRASVDPQPSSAAPQPASADLDEDVFSALKRIPDLLRPDPPTATGEAPRPPMPVGTASSEKEFGN